MSRRRKLTREQAATIRYLRRATGYSLRTLAEIYAVSTGTIRRVLDGQTHADAPWPYRDRDGWWTI